MEESSLLEEEKPTRLDTFVNIAVVVFLIGCVFLVIVPIFWWHPSAADEAIWRVRGTYGDFFAGNSPLRPSLS
jgi:hypothetical protein